MILQILAVGLLVAIVYFGVVPWIKCKRIQKGIKSPSRMVFFPLGGYIASSVVRHGKEDDLLNWLPKGKQPQERFLVTNLFASPYIILQTPELAQEYLLNHSKFFKQNLALFSEQYFTKSIAIATGEEWNRQKKLMSKAMHFDFLKNIVPSIQKTARKVFGAIKVDEPMGIYQHTFEIAAEVVSYAFFSRNMNEVKVRGIGLINKLRENMHFCVDRTPTLQFLVRILILGKDSTKWGRFLGHSQTQVLEDFKTVSKIIEDELEQRIKGDPSLAQHEDFLNYYASVLTSEQNQENKLVTIEEIVQQFITLFTAGADTTSTLAGACLYFLAKHPEHYQKLAKVADALPAQLTIEDVNSQEYLTHFVKEVSRLYPPAFDLFPRYNKQPVTLGGETFPINTYFGLGIKTIMNDPKNFPDPEKFLPERWSNAELMSPFSFLTFSAGPRNCIGEKLAMLEIKIMLIEFVRLFGLSINPKASFKMKIEQVYRMTDEFMVVPLSKQPTDKNTQLA